MKFPIYIQVDSMDCGPTCLKMISKYYGRNISIQLLRDRTQIGKEGVSLLGISEAAEAIGFRTHAVQLSYDSLIRDARLPAILHWGHTHFIILYKVKKKRLHLADPAKGDLWLTPDEFKSFWVTKHDTESGEGVALLIEPDVSFQVAGDDDGPVKTVLHFRKIFDYILPYKKLLSQLFIGLATGSLIQLILPFLTQSIVDTGVNHANLQFVYIVLLAQLALFTGRTVIEFVRGWILLHISTRINIAILIDFLVKLMKLPVSYFDSKHTGDILQRMNDHRRIESFLTDASINILFSVFNLVTFSIVLAVFDLNIFIVFALSTILYSCWVILFLQKRKRLDYRKFAVASQEQSMTIQLIQGMQEIKLNGAERSMRWRWERIQAKLFALNIKSLSLNQWQQGGAFIINEGKNIFITFLSAQAVIEGHLTVGSMLAVQYIIGQLNSPIERMIDFAQSMQNARISMDRLNEVHALPNEEPEDWRLLQHLPPDFQKKILGGGAEMEAFPVSASTHYSETLRPVDVFDTNAIHFHQVSFTYGGAGNQPVLTRINLKIPLGKTTAIVGTSGSGKTTLLKLLLKFYTPQQGEIKLGNHSLSSISHSAWRRHCSVVMQDSYIFSDSIARNIAVGEEKIDQERLDYAAGVANIREFIESLPLGYNSRIGMEGVGISMGQKQRVLIARAVYRNPDFIFFDEATNSLDANNEAVIVDNLQSFFKRRTVVIVAHRLSTVKTADQIIVLSQGEIKERGTHEELVHLKGQYYELIRKQLELGN